MMSRVAGRGGACPPSGQCKRSSASCDWITSPHRLCIYGGALLLAACSGLSGLRPGLLGGSGGQETLDAKKDLLVQQLTLVEQTVVNADMLSNRQVAECAVLLDRLNHLGARQILRDQILEETAAMAAQGNAEEAWIALSIACVRSDCYEVLAQALVSAFKMNSRRPDLARFHEWWPTLWSCRIDSADIQFRLDIALAHAWPTQDGSGRKVIMVLLGNPSVAKDADDEEVVASLCAMCLKKREALADATRAVAKDIAERFADSAGDVLVCDALGVRVMPRSKLLAAMRIPVRVELRWVADCAPHGAALFIPGDQEGVMLADWMKKMEWLAMTGRVELPRWDGPIEVLQSWDRVSDDRVHPAMDKIMRRVWSFAYEAFEALRNKVNQGDVEQASAAARAAVRAILSAGEWRCNVDRDPNGDACIRSLDEWKAIWHVTSGKQ